MIKFRMEVEQLEKKMAFSKVQTLKLVAVTLSDMAFRIRGEVQAEMRRVFDRPTPFAIRGVFARKAIISGDTVKPAVVGIAGSDSAKMTVTPAHVLFSEIEGGMRGTKASESALKRFMPAGSTQMRPGAGARLDQFGNISRGQIQQILSAMQSQGDRYANSRIKGVAGLSRSQAERIQTLRDMRRKGDEDLAAREIARIKAQRIAKGTKTQVTNYMVAPAKDGKVGSTIYAFDWQQQPGKPRPNNPRPEPVWRKTNLSPVLVFTRPQRYKVRLPFASIARREMNDKLHTILNANAARLFAKWSGAK
jgi:hypothetical protein